MCAMCPDTKIRFQIAAAQMNWTIPGKLILTESCEDPGLFVQESGVLFKNLPQMDPGVPGLFRKKLPMKAAGMKRNLL